MPSAALVVAAGPAQADLGDKGQVTPAKEVERQVGRGTGARVRLTLSANGTGTQVTAGNGRVRPRGAGARPGDTGAGTGATPSTGSRHPPWSAP